MHGDHKSYNFPSVRLTLPERNDITYKNVLNKSICDEINKSALSRVLHVADLIPCRKKADFTLHITKPSKNNVSNMLYLRNQQPPFYLLF